MTVEIKVAVCYCDIVYMFAALVVCVSAVIVILLTLVVT